MKRTVNTLGISSIILGVAAAALCFVPFGFFFSVICGFVGFILTTIYIGLNTRHQINTNKMNHGMYGLILNSIPLLYVLINLAITQLKK